MAIRTCTIEDCAQPHEARGMCTSHYAKWRRANGLTGTTDCSIDGCGKPVRARGWCSMHYNRWARNGTTHREDNPIQCGTLRGYSKHIRNDEPTCQPCRDAKAASIRAMRAATRAPAKEPTMFVGDCPECGDPMVRRRTPRALIPEGHKRARNKNICVPCHMKTGNAESAAATEQARRERLEQQQAQAEAANPALAGLMRKRRERLAREQRLAQIRRPAA